MAEINSSRSGSKERTHCSTSDIRTHMHTRARWKVKVVGFVGDALTLARTALLLWLPRHSFIVCPLCRLRLNSGVCDFVFCVCVFVFWCLLWHPYQSSGSRRGWQFGWWTYLSLCHGEKSTAVNNIWSGDHRFFIAAIITRWDAFDKLDLTINYRACVCVCLRYLNGCVRNDPVFKWITK